MKVEQLNRWIWESGDWDRWESLRASGGQVEDGNEEAWGSGDVAEGRDRGQMWQWKNKDTLKLIHKL